MGDSRTDMSIGDGSACNMKVISVESAVADVKS
jgi:hypothetical protein